MSETMFNSNHNLNYFTKCEHMKNRIVVLSLLIIYFSDNKSIAQSKNTLWYKQAAEHFEESLVLGNGKMGASVFGGITSDKIYLNDATLWSGEPVNANMNPEAYKNIPAIREALKREDYKLADSLNKRLQGSYSESYAPLGSMFIDYVHKGPAKNYLRELNISNAISKTNYEVDGVMFQREYFISYPDQVMVIRLKGSKKRSLNFNIKFKSLLKYKISSSGKTLSVNGYAPYHAEPNYRGDIPNAVMFDQDRGTRFSTLVNIKDSDGKIVATDSTLELRGGSEATILVSVATSFNGFDKNPATEGVDQRALASKNMKAASFKTFETLKESHLEDYQSFFSRLDLSLGDTEAPDLPTDERLKRYAKGEEDRNLEILYFQFGRYLLISSSRTEGAPANLQGIWNPHLRPPWSSNYTININAEENYWLAENANLSEMHLPMLSFIENVAETGKITAKTFYGVGGWAACHNTDIWAMSNPVGNFGEGDPIWANWNMGGTWLSTHLWEHYLFTQDMTFLSERGYPTMKGAAQFCLEWLVEDGQGNLVTSPSTSPENQFLTPEGYAGGTLYGSTSDMAMIRECFEQTIKASKILNIDAAFRLKLKETIERLYPYKIGKKGHLQEWYYDWEDVDPKHRHQSHLFGLYPGHQIIPLKTPALAEACRKSLEIKGDETTGWSKGWRINLWARLWDGNRAYKMYRELLNYVEPDGVKTTYHGGGGTYPNLFDAHPPFQIDGNFGGAASVIEMLVQSEEDEIRLLPALPDEWKEGSIQGVCTRGGFELSMSWANKKLTKLTIQSKKGGETVLYSGDKQREVVLKAGEKLKIDW